MQKRRSMDRRTTRRRKPEISWPGTPAPTIVEEVIRKLRGRTCARQCQVHLGLTNLRQRPWCSRIWTRLSLDRLRRPHLELIEIAGGHHERHRASGQSVERRFQIDFRQIVMATSPFVPSFIEPLLFYLPLLFRLFLTKRACQPLFKFFFCFAFALPTSINT